MPVAHAQERHGGKMSARAFAADGHDVGAEFRFGVFGKPDGGAFAIVPARGPGAFRRKAIFDADADLTRPVGNALQQRVLLVGRAQHPAAAMDMKIDALGRALGRRDHAQRNLVACLAVDFDDARPVRLRRQRKGAFAPRPGIAHFLRADIPPFRAARQRVHNRLVDGLGFVAFGFGREKGRIERVAA